MGSEQATTRPATVKSIPEIRVNREYYVLLGMLNSELSEMESAVVFFKKKGVDYERELGAIHSLKQVIRRFKDAYGDNEPC